MKSGRLIVARVVAFLCCGIAGIHGFAGQQLPPAASTVRTTSTAAPDRRRRVSSSTRRFNIYDDWRADALAPTMPLDEEAVQQCLEEFIESDYGQTMFGCHELPASYGITGELSFVRLDGPEVILSLDGKFWHRRETVLGRAAMWLNARMPEIVHVNVEDMEELQDYRDIRDEFTGEVLYREDKRSPDFNSDREVMEYQGIDPDVRGPFPPGHAGLNTGGFNINPA